jgi:LysM repeat protein
MSCKYKITNRIRFISSIVLVIILLTTTISFALDINVANISTTNNEYMELGIASGDTLWKIVTEYMTDYKDVRQGVYKLCKINDIQASDIKPGMIIKVPTSN